ncbi:Acetyl esterase/lipase [Selenomonas ruminantium]|uniref:Acetyl esterase/lipase n=1 Tax=Selenomonas ruminantium TaxID=971 RepID=A0A1M6W9P8_SELRU|nr:alpha/beta hydrolase [Selenomonas ruminantium]SHK90483.1 Acetyl esterase/lipase [Selenomonas ruminantium]
MKAGKLRKLSAAMLLSLTLAVPMTGGCSAAADKPENLVHMQPTYRDVLVADVKNDNGAPRQLRMNVFVPPKAEGQKVPVLVFVHGGGWAKGTYEGEDAQQKAADPAQGDNNSLMMNDNNSSYKIFKDVLNHGIAFVSVDYRLNNEATFPAQIYDVKAAVRFVRAHAAEYGLDADRIAIAGTSAGAHLAAELAVTSGNKALEGDEGGNLEYSSNVKACVDYYGPTNLLTMAPEMDPTLEAPDKAAETHDSVRANESILLGFTGEGQGIGTLRKIDEAGDASSPYWNMVEMAKLASPVYQVTKDAPPFFIAHGGHDSLVPIQQSLSLQKALTDAGVENIFMCNSLAPHGYQGEDTNQAMMRWLCRQLGVTY